MFVAERVLAAVRSHPARGAWIEIFSAARISSGLLCRTPQGVRGLKLPHTSAATVSARRTPQGVRGLKC